MWSRRWPLKENEQKHMNKHVTKECQTCAVEPMEARTLCWSTTKRSRTPIMAPHQCLQTYVPHGPQRAKYQYRRTAPQMGGGFDKS